MASRGLIAAIAALFSGCASIDERYHLRVDPLTAQADHDPRQNNHHSQEATGRRTPNYYRITISGWTFLSASQYAAGWYDRAAVESLFGEMKGDGKLVGVTGTRLPGHPTPELLGPEADAGARAPTSSPQSGEEKEQPRVTSVDGSDLSGKRFVIFLASNADSLIEQLRSVIRSKQVQQSLVGLLLRDEAEEYEKARTATATSRRESRVLAAKLDIARTSLRELQDGVAAARTLAPLLGAIESAIEQPLGAVLDMLVPAANPDPELPQRSAITSLLDATSARLTTTRDLALRLLPAGDQAPVRRAHDVVATTLYRLDVLVRAILDAGMALQPPPQVDVLQLTTWADAVRKMHGDFADLHRVDATWDTQLSSLDTGLTGFDRAIGELRQRGERAARVAAAAQAVAQAKALPDGLGKSQTARDVRERLKELVEPADATALGALQFEQNLAGDIAKLEEVATRTKASVDAALRTATNAAEGRREEVAAARSAVHDAAVALARKDLKDMAAAWLEFATICSDVRQAGLDQFTPRFEAMRTVVLKALAAGSKEPPPVDRIRDAESARQWLADNPGAFGTTEAK